MSAMMTLAMREEVPLSQAFARLADEEFHDVSLKGTDGGMVPANRIALSVRSDYFKIMFKKDGQFKESTDAVVSIGFSSDVLKAVVEYIHTDTGILLAKYSEDATGASSKDATGEITTDCMEEFQTLVSLTEAAMYVGLTGLCQKAQKCLAFFMKMEPSIAIAILAASKQEGPVVSEELVSRAWSVFCGITGEFCGTVLKHISAAVLGSIIQDDNAKLKNSKIFNLIHAWSKSEPSVPDNESRLNSAKDLVQNYVELEFIDPDELSSLVETSGLVTLGQLCNAFKKQAQKAKHEYNVRFHEPLDVGLVEWKEASSKTLTSSRNSWKSDILDGAAFALGEKYRWTVTTNSTFGTGAVWLGVAKTSTHTFKPDKFCGDEEDCWGVYGSNGHEYSNKYSAYRPLGEAAKFGAGSRVTMTLDLSAGAPGNGTLSISVNDQEPVVAVSDLRTHLVGGTASLVPAVSCSNASATIEDVQTVCMCK